MPRAVIVRIPTLQGLQPLSEEEISAMMREKWEALLGDSSRAGVDGQPSGDAEPNDTAEPANQPYRGEEESDSRRQDIEQVWMKMLWDIYTYPESSTSARYKRLGLSASAGDCLKSRMDKANLVIQHRVNLSGRGGQTVLLELTPKAYKALGVEKQPEQGIGSFEHRFLQRALHQHFKERYTAEIEGQLTNKKLVDLLLSDPAGVLIAVEVETSASEHILENITKDLEGGAAKVYVAATELKVMKAIEETWKRATEAKDSDGAVVITLVSRLLKMEQL